MTEGNELQATPERLIRMAWGFAPPLIIQAAITLRVFDALATGAQSLAELVETTSSSERGLSALLNALVGLALLRKDDAGRYELVDESAAFLVRERPGYHGHYFRHIATQIIPNWVDIEQAVRTGRPTGHTRPDTIPADRVANTVESMFAPNHPAARLLGQHLNVAETTRRLDVLDVGAGSGVWGIALAELSEAVHVTAIDWGGVLEVTAKVVERFGLSNRFRMQPGDPAEAAFEAGQDIVVFGHFLHLYAADRNRGLLARAFAALAPGGTMVVADFLSDWRRTEPAIALVFAVNMLLRTPEGTTYSYEEVSEWLTDAGFTDVRTLDAPAPAPLILATKPR